MAVAEVSGLAMMVASISFRARPHKRAELLSAVEATIERMRARPGCERSRLLVDSEDANAFTLISEWLSAADADAFFASREFQVFRGVKILLKDEPVIVLDEIGSRVTRLLTAR
jgi:quinol monooxygenase YgiN